MTTRIMDTGDIEQSEWDGSSEPNEVRTDAVATVEAEGKGIEFHVSMRDYTMRDMETLIVEAAAFQIIGRIGRERLAKAIEEKCIELVDAKARAALETVTTDIIDQPITPKFGDKKPVTMREFIGLTGREYLSELVDSQGNKSTDNYSRHTTSRIQFLVQGAMAKQYHDEVKKATTAVILDVQRQAKATFDVFLAAEKQRLAEAIAKVTEGR